MLHDESLSLHVSAPGLRDEKLLNSAMDRTPNLANDGEPDCADLAAAYGLGLAKKCVY